MYITEGFINIYILYSRTRGSMLLFRIKKKCTNLSSNTSITCFTFYTDHFTGLIVYFCTARSVSVTLIPVRFPLLPAKKRFDRFFEKIGLIFATKLEGRRTPTFNFNQHHCSAEQRNDEFYVKPERSNIGNTTCNGHEMRFIFSSPRFQ